MPVVVRSDILVRPDPRRVIARLFLPGQEGGAPGQSRAAAVVARCRAISDSEARDTLDHVLSDHGPRHRGFTDILDAHFAAVAHRVDHGDTMSRDRRRLIGAYFTQEYALEGAALFNPSVVAHPDQDGHPGHLRFIMSARAVGEGHISSITFRSGTFRVGAEGPGARMDTGSVLATAGTRHVGLIDRERLAHEATAQGADGESMRFVLADLPPRPTLADLDRALERLRDQSLTRVDADRTIASMRRAADASYAVTFDVDTDLSERILLPGSAAESHGMEDARFVRFTDDDGTATYLATYTAFDGTHITPARLHTDDFRTFRATPFTGRAAANKGMALFPRRVGGRHLALSRWDRENNALAASDDGYDWDDAVEIQAPSRPWDLIQLGNCGSPLETPAGWLVLTHGVGPMRGYALGAVLLDLDDPSRVLGTLTEPLLRPAPDERDGYVPNVVYTCGAVQHDGFLLLPYGCSDASIRVAFIDLPNLLGLILRGPPGTAAQPPPEGNHP
jgi:predicted GH43/DUF377 family glycosyl hydrolase